MNEVYTPMKSLIKSLITFGVLVLAKTQDKNCNKKNTNPTVVEEEEVDTQNGNTTEVRKETTVENASPKIVGLMVGTIMLIAGLTM